MVSPSNTLIQGRVVWASVPDPQGSNPKRRRCVVYSKNSEIGVGGRLLVVGITSELSQSPKEHYVPLQYGPNCWTGLTEPSAALCTWVVELPVTVVEATKWFVPPKSLVAILETVDRLKQAGHLIPLIKLD